VETRFHSLSLAPTVRYTRWAADPSRYGSNQLSGQNQVEFLVSIRPAVETSIHPFGGRVSLGAVVGLSLTRDYWTSPASDVPLNTFEFNGIDYTTFVHSGAHSVVAGPSMEVAFGRLAGELDAVYRSYRQYFHTVVSDGRAGPEQTGNVATWEFPLLAKYRFGPTRGARPFIEAGPSIRIPGTVGHFGALAGAGVGLPAWRLRIAPTMRYTRWFDDRSGTNRNEVQLLLAVSF
jgi:hypothetical protein